MRTEGRIDWAFAEALAFGTLLVEGTTVRLSGQVILGADLQSAAMQVIVMNAEDGRRSTCRFNNNHRQSRRQLVHLYDSLL